LNILTGFNGQISLGHGAFFAVGAYTSAVLIDQANWPFWATLPLAAIMCFVVGYLFGLPALRSRATISRLPRSRWPWPCRKS
jgi:branched-chain amino acid transport system permease protein